jgi:hypothetical protein
MKQTNYGIMKKLIEYNFNHKKERIEKIFESDLNAILTEKHELSKKSSLEDLIIIFKKRAQNPTITKKEFTKWDNILSEEGLIKYSSKKIYHGILRYEYEIDSDTKIEIVCDCTLTKKGKEVYKKIK